MTSINGYNAYRLAYLPVPTQANASAALVGPALAQNLSPTSIYTAYPTPAAAPQYGTLGSMPPASAWYGGSPPRVYASAVASQPGPYPLPSPSSTGVSSAAFNAPPPVIPTLNPLAQRSPVVPASLPQQYPVPDSRATSLDELKARLETMSDADPSASNLPKNRFNPKDKDSWWNAASSVGESTGQMGEKVLKTSVGMAKRLGAATVGGAIGFVPGAAAGGVLSYSWAQKAAKYGVEHGNFLGVVGPKGVAGLAFLGAVLTGTFISAPIGALIGLISYKEKQHSP